MMQEIKCCICGKRIPVFEGNNPYPVKESSAWGSDKNRCCHSCNRNFVLPYRMMLNGRNKKDVDWIHKTLKSYTYKSLLEVTEQVFGKEIAQ